MILLRNNLANLIVLLRTLLVFVVLPLLIVDEFHVRLFGLFLLGIVAILDGVDGYLARKLNIVSGLGARLDTMGDRITENVLFIFLACKNLTPLFVPVIFVTRSLLADFLRAMHDKQGVGTFEMNKSLIGRLVIASKTARVSYLLLKFAAFMAGAAYLTFTGVLDPDDRLLAMLHKVCYQGGILAVGFNLLRFFVLLYDSKDLLRKEFGG